MVILVPIRLHSSRQGRLQMCLKLCMVKIAFCIGGAQTNNSITKTLKYEKAARSDLHETRILLLRSPVGTI
jgi:hypothetical protein